DCVRASRLKLRQNIVVSTDPGGAFTTATLRPGLICSFRSKLHKIEHAIKCTSSWPAGAVRRRWGTRRRRRCDACPPVRCAAPGSTWFTHLDRGPPLWIGRSLLVPGVRTLLGV